MKNCKQCQKETENPIQYSFCSKECQMAYDRERKRRNYLNKPEIELTCQNCQKIFKTRDKRKKACNDVCVYALRAADMLTNRGYSNPAQKPRTEEERQRISANKSAAAKLNSKQREEKRQITVKAMYGDLSFGTRAGVLEKRKATNRAKYGGDSPFSSAEVRAKAKGTFKENYGQEYYLQSDAWKQNNLDKFGNEQIFASEKFLNQVKIWESAEEREVKDYVASLGFTPTKIRRDRVELDIYVQEKSIGFEYNGLYWHSNRNSKMDKYYHFNKTQVYAKHGIQVIHIYSSEWKNRQAQVKSRIRSLLGCNGVRIGVRKCEVRSISRHEANQFLDAFHIQGAASSTLQAYGAYYNDQLMAVTTFGWHHRQPGLVTLNRFACREDVSIHGALSKFSKMASQHFKADIRSWCDLRWSNGAGYKAAGWELNKFLPVDYVYTKNFLKTISKQSRQKKKIGTPDGMTEREHATADGLAWIYDCGKLVFIYRYKP